jgi:hypothetical protein
MSIQSIRMRLGRRLSAAQRAAAAVPAPAFAPGCSRRLLNYGASPSERGADGTTSAQVGQAELHRRGIGADFCDPVGDVISALAGLFDAGDAAAVATEATEAARTATSAAEAEPTLCGLVVEARGCL